jgi:CheY-like chemotaxis protein
MSALPLTLRDASVQGRILKLYNKTYTLDPYHDRLASVGFDVIDAANYAEALLLAHQHHPDLIVVYDDPSAGIDALAWLDAQHNDRLSWMATTPLMILADALRAPDLRRHELADRVVVVLRRADTLNQLTRTVRRLLHINRWS